MADEKQTNYLLSPNYFFLRIQTSARKKLHPIQSQRTSIDLQFQNQNTPLPNPSRRSTQSSRCSCMTTKLNFLVILVLWPLLKMPTYLGNPKILIIMFCFNIRRRLRAAIYGSLRIVRLRTARQWTNTQQGPHPGSSSLARGRCVSEISQSRDALRSKAPWWTAELRELKSECR